MAVPEGAAQQLHGIPRLQGFHQHLLPLPPIQVTADHLDLGFPHHSRPPLPVEVPQHPGVAEGAVALCFRQSYKDIGGEIRDADLLSAVAPLAYFGKGGGKGLNPLLSQFLGYLQLVSRFCVEDEPLHEVLPHGVFG